MPSKELQTSGPMVPESRCDRDIIRQGSPRPDRSAPDALTVTVRQGDRPNAVWTSNVSARGYPQHAYGSKGREVLREDRFPTEQRCRQPRDTTGRRSGSNHEAGGTPTTGPSGAGKWRSTRANLEWLHASVTMTVKSFSWPNLSLSIPVSLVSLVIDWKGYVNYQQRFQPARLQK